MSGGAGLFVDIVADFGAPLLQEIPDVSLLQREADVEYHRQAVISGLVLK